MTVKLIGEHPFFKNNKGDLKSHLGTVFVPDRVIITSNLPHGFQKHNYLSEKRKAKGLPELEPDEEADLCYNTAVDLVIQNDSVLIRPVPKRMNLAYKADEILQEIVSKRKIKFLGVNEPKVREYVKTRGDLWRINPLPKTADEITSMICNARQHFGELTIYYNAELGIRYLPLGEFRKLLCRDYQQALRHLADIRDYLSRKNERGCPELAFFQALGFGLHEYRDVDFTGFGEQETKSCLENLTAQFENAVPVDLRADDIENPAWKDAMYRSLLPPRCSFYEDTCETGEETRVLERCAEVHNHVHWKPGASVGPDGELDFDPVFEEKIEDKKIFDEKVMYIIRVFQEKMGRLSYINVGKIDESMSKRKNGQMGRREVYFALFQVRGSKKEMRKWVRMQKWDTHEIMEKDKVDVSEAALRSGQYRINIDDRYEACRQLGMNLLPIDDGIICETIEGKEVPLFYFIKDFVDGYATDKIPSAKYLDRKWANQFAKLQGAAAASSAICCKIHEDTGKIAFDDGDEVISENIKGYPDRLTSLDFTGAFKDTATPLEELACQFVPCISRRTPYLRDPEEFAGTWINAFVSRGRHIQGYYRRKKSKFRLITFGRMYDAEKKTFAYVLDMSLQRLDRTDFGRCGEIMRDMYKAR
jgi:hypothetical protein